MDFSRVVVRGWPWKCSGADEDVRESDTLTLPLAPRREAFALDFASGSWHPLAPVLPQCRRTLALAVVVAVTTLGAPWPPGVVAPASGADRTSIPLKNWGGFAISRDAVYDDLERLVTAGLADRTLLSTKPLSRIETARIVGRAVQKIRSDTGSDLNGWRDLEPVLDRLIEEFRAELAGLGVALGGEPGPPPRSVLFLPVDRAQARAAWVSRDMAIPSSQGLRLWEGANGGFTFESRAQIGDWLTVYLQPELIANEDFGAARLTTGYLKLTVFNVELLVGRDSLWWGPGLRGSLVLSNNAPPLDQIRIGAAEPFLLPWVGQWIGPTKLLFFIAQLEERRDHPRAQLAGMRATVSPASFLELGVSRVTQFGGSNGGSPDAWDTVRILFDVVEPQAGDDPQQEPALRSNNVFALDVDIRIPNVARWGLPARDLRIYGEMGWDDTCCETHYVPLREALSGLAGIQLLGLLGHEGVDARLEWAKTSRLTFNHSQFRNGYWTRGHAIGHYIGTDGEEYFKRITNRLSPDLMLGLQVSRATIGNTLRQFRGPKEKRVGGGIDVSYRLPAGFSLFAGYEIMDVTNRAFRRGDDGFDHIVRFELTRSFR